MSCLLLFGCPHRTIEKTLVGLYLFKQVLGPTLEGGQIKGCDSPEYCPVIKGKSQCITAGVLPIEVADLLIHRDNGKHHLTKQGFLVSGSFRRVKLSEVEASLVVRAT